MKPTGNIAGLKSSQLKLLSNIYQRRAIPGKIVSSAIANILIELSEETGREIGVFINRKGEVVNVVVGDSKSFQFPELEWKERGRLAGVRVIHAHPTPFKLKSDDISNLIINRLDIMAVVFREDTNHPVKIEYAYTNATGGAIRNNPIFLGELDFNFLVFIKELENELWQHEKIRKIYKNNQGILVVVAKDKKTVERRTVELKELCKTAGIHIDFIHYQVRNKIDNRTLVGKGKLDEILVTAKKFDSDMLVFDPELSPTQARAVTNITEIKVIDRTMLILDIFAQHAKTREGKLQVELAQLKYTLPRLIMKNTMMSRLMGGIGGRGPGETKLEVDRRRVKSKIGLLEKMIGKLSSQRALQRKRRVSKKVPTVSIVGYTNAGKSTLLKAITGADVTIENKLFATLDPRTRRVRFPRQKEIIFTDTVGFIEDLPEDLQMAFRATLEELDTSDLIIHLVDISDPDNEHKEKAVKGILNEMGLGGIPNMVVYNKVDKLSFIPPIDDSTYYISAVDKTSITGLVESIIDYFGQNNYLEYQATKQ